MIKYIGIDGCKSGWFYVGLDQAGNSSFGVFCEISELSAFLACAEMALIDIPIGLRGRHRDERLCDKQARAVLSANKKPCSADSSFYSRLIATQRLWCQANQKLISII